ncbi:hypothetical protein Pint_11329 [Pistacia integerrima]|uniref:Uncharacterized protein n=1 Tax=Pistacia integerrima TaxID=434235 RepID=A0ACC0XII5_9ROSI|nr:hypothetical protein Pint_11329 [Pistacia integerrima]
MKVLKQAEAMGKPGLLEIYGREDIFIFTLNQPVFVPHWTKFDTSNLSSYLSASYDWTPVGSG